MSSYFCIFLLKSSRRTWKTANFPAFYRTSVRFLLSECKKGQHQHTYLPFKKSTPTLFAKERNSILCVPLLNLPEFIFLLLCNLIIDKYGVSVKVFLSSNPALFSAFTTALFCVYFYNFRQNVDGFIHSFYCNMLIRSVPRISTCA